MSNAQEIPKLSDPDGYLKCLKECCLIGTVDVIYVPQLKKLVSPYGSTQLPKEYAEHPQLALFYYSYMINKNLITVTRSELTFEWPKPYVVLNTIVKRLENHTFITQNKYTRLTSIVKNQIGKGIECPTNETIEVLTPFVDPRKRLTISIRLGPKSEALDFFTELTDLKAAQSKYENLSKLEVRISCRQWFNSSLDVERTARNIRKLWVLEMILSGAESSIEDEDEIEDQETDLYSMFMREPSDAEMAMDHGVFWDKISQLQQNQLLPNEEGDDEEAFKRLSDCARRFDNLLEEIKKKRLVAKNEVYTFLRQVMFSEGRVKINRGIRCTEDGIVKLSLSYGPCKWIKRVGVTLTIQQTDNKAYDIHFGLKCFLSFDDPRKKLESK